MTPKPLRGVALVTPVTCRVDNGRPFLQHGGAGLLPLAAAPP
jgi:hypothetical protein